jgi:hypothetical protein
MRHTGGLLRRAVSMVVQLETYGLEARFGTISQRGALAWRSRKRSKNLTCMMHLCGIGFIQFGPDRISLARHFEFGEKCEGLVHPLPLSLLVALLPCQPGPLPIAVTQPALVAQLQADRFLLL